LIDTRCQHKITATQWMTQHINKTSCTICHYLYWRISHNIRSTQTRKTIQNMSMKRSSQTDIINEICKLTKAWHSVRFFCYCTYTKSYIRLDPVCDVGI
jgi:hypothetical protein